MATLKVHQDHEANEYWVEHASTKNAEQPRQTPQSDPDNPVNPDGNVGIDGIDGIVSPAQRTTERKSWRPTPRTDFSDPAVREQFTQAFRRALGALTIPDDPDAQPVGSESDPNVTYQVTKTADGVLQCTCPGYRFRRTCKHVVRCNQAAKNSGPYPS